MYLILILLIQYFLNEIKRKKVRLIWKIRKMQSKTLLLAIAIIQFYFKTISIFLKNKLLILQNFKNNVDFLFLTENEIEFVQMRLFLQGIVSLRTIK